VTHESMNKYEEERHRSKRHRYHRREDGRKRKYSDHDQERQRSHSRLHDHSKQGYDRVIKLPSSQDIHSSTVTGEHKEDTEVKFLNQNNHLS
jgi:hypothetical protein